ncbi:MAG: GxxExxY protein [Acidobacteriota bacterium]|nr:GxxExxY protein [Acidobacteriota bacterium]
MNLAGTAPARSPRDVSHAVITAAMKVHTVLGPGLLESAYEACLAHELRNAGHKVDCQLALPIVYDGVQLDVGYRIDMLVDDVVVIEIKCVGAINNVHKAQIISYLKLSKHSLGLIVNFHVEHLKDGIKRFVSGNKWK